MLMRYAGVAGALVAGAAMGGSAAAAQASRAPACTLSGAISRIAALPEASGFAASRATAGQVWALNDSGKPVLLAIDANGTVAGRVVIAGASVDDWEALASAPCGGGLCLYVGDIGDNNARRRAVVIYRIPEPSPADGTARASGVFRASYPDGAHDAEALLAGPDGTLYIVTKGETGAIALYRFPGELTDGPMKLERIGELRAKGQVAEGDRITDGAISADGRWVALRTKTSLTFYPAADFLKGRFTPAARVDLTPLGEPQGEAVAFGTSNIVYVGGEGGGKAQPGTIASLSCTF